MGNAPASPEDELTVAIALTSGNSFITEVTVMLPDPFATALPIRAVVLFS